MFLSKQHRVDQLAGERFEFLKLDLEDQDKVSKLFDQHHFDAVINLAARAGVRYSMLNPYVYMTTKRNGQPKPVRGNETAGNQKVCPGFNIIFVRRPGNAI